MPSDTLLLVGVPLLGTGLRLTAADKAYTLSWNSFHSTGGGGQGRTTTVKSVSDMWAAREQAALCTEARRPLSLHCSRLLTVRSGGPPTYGQVACSACVLGLDAPLDAVVRDRAAHSGAPHPFSG